MSWCHIYYITSVILYIYSGYVTASEYYVSAAPNGESCPSTDLPCHNLTYYTADYASYFTDDTIFYFLEGIHTLQGTLEINNVTNITLQGLGHIEQGFHETVMQSTSIIMCSDTRECGIELLSSRSVAMKSLTIANCGFNIYINDQIHFNETTVSLLFVDIVNVTLEQVSVQNSSSFGLGLVNAYDVLITNSSFARNGAPKAFRGNTLILYNDQYEAFFRVNIVKSNFTLGLGYGMIMLYDNDNEAEIIIENSKFSHNNGGGGILIQLYEESGSIEFRNCTIYNNIAQNDGGGVSIESYRNSSIKFSNCIIYNNTAIRFGGGVYIYSEGDRIELGNCAIYNNIAQSFGGGIKFISLDGSSIEFRSCTIYNNYAELYGGGVDIDSYGGISRFGNCTIYNNVAQQYAGGGIGAHIASYENRSIVTFVNCTIYNNSAQQYGGGVGFSSSGDGSVKFSNCTIYKNTGTLYGGGLLIGSYGNGSFEIANSTIYNNTAYLGSGLFLHASRVNITSKASIHFKNILVQFNKVTNKLDRYQSAVALINIENVIFDHIKVSNRNTTGLVGFNSLITFDGNNTFMNNSGIYGGGIALYESSQLLIKKHTNISFFNNHASESGGGIFVTQLLYVNISTECFISYNSSDNSSAVLNFINNIAERSGDVLYGGDLNTLWCSNNFDLLFSYPQQTGLSVVSSDPIQVCFCEFNTPNCSVKNISITAMSGIDVTISLATVGSRNGLTNGMIKLTDISSNEYTAVYNIISATCTNINYKLKANTSTMNTTLIYVRLERSISDHLQDPYAKVIEVTIESCPIGFPLVNDTCVCRSELNTSSITCDINTQIITRDGDIWIGYENDSNCLIVYHHCPFDYCNDGIVHFKITSPHPQCLHNRSGLLCGQCSEGLSLLLGTNQCGQCTNNYIALIIPFALAGIALVAFLITLNLTVSVGTINGLIFYANVVKIYKPIFFPDGPIPFLSQFISWINLDLGIETCFIDGMGSCSKAWLQFFFPAYVWFILLLVIILSRYSSKVVQLVGRQVIPVLATMILLSYTKLIRIVFQVLHHTNIECSGENNVRLLRWYIDANVQYVRGCHIPLFLFSLAVLILLIIPYTFYLLTIPLFEGPLSKYMHSCQSLTNMKPFFDAYGGPYKDKCRFWTGFLLLVRVILALVVSLDTEATVSLCVLTSILVIIIFMYLPLKGIYRHFSLVCLEEFFILNLVLMAHMNLPTSEKPKRQVTSINIVLMSISFIVFCGILLYHVWDRLLKSHSHIPIEKFKKIFKKPPPPSSSNDVELPSTRPGSPSVESKPTSTSILSVEMRRESLLFDDQS